MPQLGVGLFIGDTDGDSIVGPVIDGVIMAEDGAYIITESGVDKLAFEPAGNTPQTFTNSDSSFSVTVNGMVGNFSWNAITNATAYHVHVSTINDSSAGSNIGFSTVNTTKNLDMDSAFSGALEVYAFLRPQFADGSYGSYIPTLTLYVHD